MHRYARDVRGADVGPPPFFPTSPRRNCHDIHEILSEDRRRGDRCHPGPRRRPQGHLAELDDHLAKIGASRVEGVDKVADKEVPVIYFGQRKINNNFNVVDGIRQNHQATATVFVKAGDEFVRVSTNVLTPEGKRGIAPSWPATPPTTPSPKASSSAAPSTCWARPSTPATTRSRTVRARPSG
ncbi:MAG: Cache 3/Cache 2 fusion domain-containing protein [Hydrogenophaga sp.]|nr:Cache 3/Cache 2 fusion domain-containing protein [Hydrogenophaga sp.]